MDASGAQAGSRWSGDEQLASGAGSEAIGAARNLRVDAGRWRDALDVQGATPCGGG